MVFCVALSCLNVDRSYSKGRTRLYIFMSPAGRRLILGAKLCGCAGWSRGAYVSTSIHTLLCNALVGKGPYGPLSAHMRPILFVINGIWYQVVVVVLQVMPARLGSSSGSCRVGSLLGKQGGVSPSSSHEFERDAAASGLVVWITRRSSGQKTGPLRNT